MCFLSRFHDKMVAAVCHCHPRFHPACCMTAMWLRVEDARMLAESKKNALLQMQAMTCTRVRSVIPFNDLS